MPKAFPKEFCRDVIAMAKKREATLAQIAKDFGVSLTVKSQTGWRQNSISNMNQAL